MRCCCNEPDVDDSQYDRPLVAGMATLEGVIPVKKLDQRIKRWDAAERKKGVQLAKEIEKW